MSSVLDIFDALTGGTVGVVSALFEHLGGFLSAVGELVDASSADDAPVVEAE
mgnify:CR=1 FL=1